MFSKYHYLTHSINIASDCYVAIYKNKPIAFISIINFPNKIGLIKKIHRLVVLPEYQGLGIGTKLLNIIAPIYKDKCKFVGITTSNISLIQSLKKQKNWVCFHSGRVKGNNGLKAFNNTRAVNRFTTSWKYVGE